MLLYMINADLDDQLHNRTGRYEAKNALTNDQ